MHNEAFVKLDLDYAYLAFEVGTEQLEGTIKGFRAINVRGSKEKSVNVYTNTSLMEVKENSFLAELEIKEIKFDYGFVCLGMVSEKRILSSLQEKFEENNIPVVNIGDSFRPIKILEGVEEGRFITNTLANMGLLN